MGNSSSQGALNGTAYTLVVTAAGYTRNNTVNIVVNGSNNNTALVTVPLITPVLSTVASSAVSNTGAVISWTVTATDYVNNNYVGNRVLYTQDSNYANNLFYTAWSNSTSSPSFTLSNLDLSKTYYYRVQTYNSVTSANSATSDGSFTTSHGKPSPTYLADGGYVYAQPGQASIAGSGQQPVNNVPDNKPKIAVFAVLVIVVLAYFLLVYKK